jgi:hypothetical protein
VYYFFGFIVYYFFGFVWVWCGAGRTVRFTTTQTVRLIVRFDTFF